MTKHFNFLGLFFGKGFYCLFLGLICLNTKYALCWACSMLFFISSLFYILLGFTFCSEERKKMGEMMNDGSPSSQKNEERAVDIKQKSNDQI